jgi:hypothetical protein
VTRLRQRRWFVAVLLLVAGTAAAAWAPKLAAVGSPKGLFVLAAAVAGAAFLALSLQAQRAAPDDDRRRAARAVWIVALAQRAAVLFAPAWLADEPHGGDVLVRAVVLAADLALVALLLRKLEQVGHPPARAILYAWHPLVALEFAAGGRADAFGLVLLAAALSMTGAGARRSLASGALAGIAGAVAPMGLAPVVGWFAQRRLRALLAAAAMLFLLLGAPRVAARATAPESTWPFELVQRATAEPPSNGLLHPSLARLAEWGEATFGGGDDPELALRLGRLLSTAFFVAIAVALARRLRERPAMLALGIVVAWLATAPTVQPRDVAWLAPFLPFLPPRRARALLLLTATILAAYVLRLRVGIPGPEPAWIALVTWLPPCALGAIELWRAGAPSLGGVTPREARR